MSDSEERKKRIYEVTEELQSKGPHNDKGFRVVITGKGGVGKTTLTALLAKLFSKSGYNVLAADEDPQMNLPFALGIPRDQEITPISKNFDYIEEKVGARPGASWGGLLSLNPDVSDVVDRFGVKTDDGINLLVMGSVIQAAAGCLCPENTLLEATMNYICLRENEIILMDTQAGVEHFGRALAKGFKQAVVVTEPTFNSYQVALHAAKLARQLGISYIHLVISKIIDNSKKNKFMEMAGKSLDGFDKIFTLPYYDQVLNTEPDITPLLNEKSSYIDKVNNIAQTLKAYGEKK